ncbi:RNA polymerase sigma factor [Sunxiuqinia sp. A32]
MKNRVIWDNFREGSKEALEIIYEENYSSLFHYGMKFTPDEHEIKDIIQELFVELINSGTKLSPTNNIRFYLLRAMRNKLIKHLQSAKLLAENSTKNIVNTDFSLFESVENQLIQKEIEEAQRKSILSSINKLSQKQQEIIYLRFYNNMPYQEIADLFEVKIQTVRNLMNRAINSIREDIEDDKINKGLILFALNLSI